MSSGAQSTNHLPPTPNTNESEEITITPESIQHPMVVAALRCLHPCDWPSTFIRQLFTIPDELPNGADLPLSDVPSASEGLPDSKDYYDALETVLDVYQDNRRLGFVTLVQVFLRWLGNVRVKLGHTTHGIHLDLLGKSRYFDTPVTLTFYRHPFMTVMTDIARMKSRSRPLIGRLYGLREREAELGVCGHDFGVLLALAQRQRFVFGIERDMYKVHIMYPSYAKIEIDRAIIITANVPGRLLDGLREEPPKIYHEGLTLTRNTVELPRKNQKPQDFQLFQVLMAIITEQVETLEPFLIAQYKW